MPLPSVRNVAGDGNSACAETVKLLDIAGALDRAAHVRSI
jgi:hypothetical protein